MIGEKNKSNNNLSFPQMEEVVLKFWESADTFNKSLEKEAPCGDYVFYDGPPFATGTPHYGHIVASIMKDVVPRYQTMRGYHVDRKWGWDCHGLPIENIVEKELGTKTKKEIEALGVGKFNDLCRARVLTYVDDWKKVIRRLGRWADMENAYKTMDLSFMDSIWWAFKQLWDKDLIYKDYRSMHVCPRCETTLSQSEVTEGYRNIKDLSVVAKFRLEPGQKIGSDIVDDNTYILAWTTTPWTLIGNVALAVGENIEYVKVKINKISENKSQYNFVAGESYFFSIKLLENILGLIINKESPKSGNASGSTGHEDKVVIHYNLDFTKINSSDLVGLKYQPLFDYYSSDKSLNNHAKGWKIYAADFVTTEEGTGVVHIAPAFGEDDMKLGQDNDLPFIQHVGMDGIMKKEAGEFAGKNISPRAKNKPEEIREIDLEIVRFLEGQVFKSEKYTHSYPHCWRCETPLINYATSSWFVGVTKIKDQLLTSAKNINWSPSYIKEGRFGNWLAGARDWSISRQRFWASAIPIWECTCGERQVVGGVAELKELSGLDINDIHKDKVDSITFPCQKCGDVMKRIPDVLDCWFESGSMPFAQLHYPMENKEKFERNFPAQFIAEGVDQTRAWFYYLHVIAGGIFGRETYKNAMVNGIVLAEDGKKMSKRLQNYPDPSLVMEKYGSDALRAYLASSPVMTAENLNFSESGVQESLRKNIMVLWNVYKFYEMFAIEGTKTGEDDGARAVNSRNILDQWILAKLNLLVKEITAALEAYSLPKAMRPITEFIDELSTWYLRRSRDRFKSDDETDKQAALVTTKYVLIELAKLMAPFMPFIAETLWQKVGGYDFKEENKSVHLAKWPEVQNFDKKKKKVLEEMVLVRHIAELGLAKRDEAGIKIRQMLGKLTVSGTEELAPEYLALIRDELNIQTVEFVSGTAENISVELDITITPELKQEGIKREIIRFVNMLRKDAGLSLNDKTRIYLSGAEGEVKEAAEKTKTEVMKDTLSSDFVFIDSLPKVSATKDIKIDGLSLELGIQKQ